MISGTQVGKLLRKGAIGYVANLVVFLELKVRLGFIFKIFGSLWLYVMFMMDSNGFMWVKLGFRYILPHVGV